MTRLSLPDVTVVLIDNVELPLARLALRATLEQITPAEVHIWSDNWPEGELFDVPVILFPEKMGNLRDVERLLWTEVPKQLKTSHMLTIQWDGFVLDADMWNPEFLMYDYIGAPWPQHIDYNIGNGGFSLRSRNLMLELELLKIVGPEDNSLCRFYRRQMESLGYKWAPYDVAKAFSRERIYHTDRTFGFHGVFNFPLVLSQTELVARVAAAGPYARGHCNWSQMLGVANA